VHLPRPIDASLGTAFRVADALASGASEKRLRARDLSAPFHGVRTSSDVNPVRAYAPRLRRGDRFSHTTAAAMWGAPLPRRFEDEVHVAATLAQRPRARGCVGHESGPATAVRRGGLPVSDPAQTLIECATLLGLDDLVAIADHLVLDPHVLDPLDLRPYVTLPSLGARLATSRGHGVRIARRALALTREGVESPMETRLRLLLARAGLPEPLCGYELRRPNGSRIGWFDLAWPEHRVIAEYDGDAHRTSTYQYDRDIGRFDAAAAVGWQVVRVRKRGVLLAPAETVHRVSEALGQHFPSQSATPRPT
jgi:very-short-patch-repair endonuclease